MGIDVGDSAAEKDVDYNNIVSMKPPLGLLVSRQLVCTD